MFQERPISERDLLKVVNYLRRFDIIKIERHDESGGFRFISKHGFFNKGPKLLEQSYPEIYRDRITINNGLDSMFYAFEITPNTHRFVISSSVLKRLVENDSEDIRLAADEVINTIKGLYVDEDSSVVLNEILNLVGKQTDQL